MGWLLLKLKGPDSEEGFLLFKDEDDWAYLLNSRICSLSLPRLLGSLAASLFHDAMMMIPSSAPHHLIESSLSSSSKKDTKIISERTHQRILPIITKAVNANNNNMHGDDDDDAWLTLKEASRMFLLKPLK
ncbi:hypothetical protein RIF29_15024 [Crotalaria pallida]|uniref:Uncharacterized protein n=1 Tax=Crotalaria pallida TaxID=3830 RepID=A0AAN9IIW1_CROPI